MIARTFLCVASLTLSALAPASAAGSAPDGYTQAAAAEIGAWRIQAWNTRGQAFAGCTAHRVDGGVVASFARSTSSYNLVLSSSRWRLEEQSTRTVTLVAGSATALAEAHVTRPTNLFIVLQRNSALTPRILNELRTAGSLQVRTAGGTIHVPADQAAAALAELDRCWREQGDDGATGSIGKARL